MVPPIAVTPIAALTVVPIAAPVQTSPADRYAAADRCAAPVQIAVVDRCAVEDRYAALAQSVVGDRSAESRHVEADHVGAAVRAEEFRRVVALRTAESQRVALVQNVVTPDGVRVVTQKDGDRSAQADLRVEVDRSARFAGCFRLVGCFRFLADRVRVSRLHPLKVAQHARAAHQVAARDEQLHPTAALQPIAAARSVAKQCSAVHDSSSHHYLANQR